MYCPSCGFEQPPGYDQGGCIQCGIDFEKFQAAVRAGAAAVEAAAGHPGAGPASLPGNPILAPVGRVARTVRTLTGLALLGVAALMFLNGAALKAFYPYAISLFFAGGGLWVLVTSLQPVTVRRFAMEMVVLVAVSLALRVSYPELLSTDSAPVAEAADRPMAPNPYGGFVTEARHFRDGAAAILEQPEVRTEDGWHRLVVDAGLHRLLGRYRSLSTADRTRAFAAYTAAREASELLRATVPQTHPTRGEQPARMEVPDDVRALVVRKLEDLEKALRDLEGTTEPEATATVTVKRP